MKGLVVRLWYALYIMHQSRLAQTAWHGSLEEDDNVIGMQHALRLGRWEKWFHGYNMVVNTKTQNTC